MTSNNDNFAVLRAIGFIDGNGNVANKDALYLYPDKLAVLCGRLAHMFDNDKVNIVISPDGGKGMIISNWVVHRLKMFLSYEVVNIFADKRDTKFAFHPEHRSLIQSGNVLIVDDIINTGESVKSLVDAVRHLNGNVVGVGAIYNYGLVTSNDISAPKLFTLASRI